MNNPDTGEPFKARDFSIGSVAKLRSVSLEVRIKRSPLLYLDEPPPSMVARRVVFIAKGRPLATFDTCPAWLVSFGQVPRYACEKGLYGCFS